MAEDAVRQALQEQRYADALALLDPDSTDPLVLTRRALALRRLGRAAEGRDAARRAVAGASGAVLAAALSELARYDGEDKRAVLLRGIREADAAGAVVLASELRLRLGAFVLDADPRAAEALLAEVEAVTGASAEVLLARARLALRRGRLDDARSALVEATASPDAADGELWRRVRVALGDLETTAARPEEALRWFRAVLDRASDEPVIGRSAVDAWIGAGEAARALGRLDEAEECYRRVLGTGGAGETGARTNLAIVALLRGDVAGARAGFAAVDLSEAPAVVDAAVALGLAACAAHDGDDEAFERAFRRFVSGEDEHVPDADLALLSRIVARSTARRSAPWPARAARARRVSLRVWERLGRTKEIEEDRRALRRLADQGAPIPLGPFLVGQRLGRGAFGQVRRASHDAGIEVAVKLLAVRDPDAARQLENELRAVAVLDHPHVVRLLHHGRVDGAAAAMDASLEPGTAWIATELARRGTLEPLLGALDWGPIRRVLVALLDALAHAHARGLLHLDVKPANVLLVGDELEVRLADFGLATAIGTTSATASGTPHYMAPEQFAGVSGLGPWTDLYAVGCVAGALVSGAPPFGGTTLDALRTGHFEGQPAITPRMPVPAGFLPWVRRLLVKSPAERFRRAADAARALLALGPAGGAATRGGVAQDDAPTVVLPAADDLGLPPVAALEGELCPIPPPAVPLRWETPRADARVELVEAGLGLFGLRAPAMVGRNHERSLLWAALRDVVGDGTARAVAMEADSGAGSSALLDWIAERAHEVGAATVLRVRPEPDDPPGAAVRRALARRWGAAADGASGGIPDALARLARRRPVLIAIDDAGRAPDTVRLVTDVLGTPVRLLAVLAWRPGEVPDPLADHDAALVLPIAPLPPAEHRALLSARLALAPSTLDRLATATAGSARFAVQLLTDLVHRDRLVPTPGGFALRDGEVLPSSLEELWRRSLGAALVGAPADVRAALAAAARLGPVVREDAWAEACASVGVRPVPDLVRRLVAARLVVERDEGWAFADPALAATLQG